MNWDDLRYLLAVDRAGSFSAAGRLLGVDQVTVGRRVAALQESVGATLVERTPSGTVLTAAGRQVADAARQMGALADGVRRSVAAAKDEVAGTLRITAPGTLTSHVIAARVAELRRAHPHLEVELLGTARSVDLAKLEADVAVRLVRPVEPGLSAQRVGTVAYGIYAARKRGRAPLELLTYDESLASTPEMAWVREALPTVPVAMRSNSIDALVEAVRGGAGMAVLPCFLADKGLERIEGMPPIPPRELWIVTHEETRRSRRVRAGIDFVARVLREAEARLRGAA